MASHMYGLPLLKTKKNVIPTFRARIYLYIYVYIYMYIYIYIYPPPCLARDGARLGCGLFAFAFCVASLSRIASRSPRASPGLSWLGLACLLGAEQVLGPPKTPAAARTLGSPPHSEQISLGQLFTLCTPFSESFVHCFSSIAG